MPKERERTKDLQLFFDFVNAELKQMAVSDFSSYLVSYKDLLTAFDDVIQGYDITEKISNMMSQTISSEKEFEEVRKVFVAIQNYLKMALSGIQNSASGQQELSPLTDIKSEYNLYMDAERDTFNMKFDASKIKTDTLSIGTEKKLLNIILTSLLMKYDLKPSRFHLCERNNCVNYFYRTTKTAKYCSKKCSSAENVAALRRRKKDSEK